MIEKQKIITLLVVLLSATVLNASEISGVDTGPRSHYFGSFKRDKGVKIHTFKLKNTGTDPLLIKRVRATCGCTATKWTSKPVLPGEQAEVEVRFDPKKFSGYFSKKVSVFTNRSNAPIDFMISGRIQVNNKISDDFVHFIGDLKADKSSVDFGELEWSSGMVKQEIRFINIMRDTIRLNTGRAPGGIKIEQSRKVLPPGGNCKLSVFFNPAEYGKWGALDTLILLNIKRNIKSETRKLPVNLVVVDDFSKLDEQQRALAPQPNITENTPLDYCKPGQWKSKKLELQNTGKSELLIRRLETNNKNIRIKKYDERIAPGKSGKIVLTYSTDAKEFIKEDELIVWNNTPYAYRLVVPLRMKKSR